MTSRYPTRGHDDVLTSALPKSANQLGAGTQKQKMASPSPRAPSTKTSVLLDRTTSHPASSSVSSKRKNVASTTLAASTTEPRRKWSVATKIKATATPSSTTDIGHCRKLSRRRFCGSRRTTPPPELPAVICTPSFTPRLGGLDDVLQQHRARHRAHSTWHRCHISRNIEYFGCNIANETCLGTGDSDI